MLNITFTFSEADVAKIIMNDRLPFTVDTVKNDHKIRAELSQRLADRMLPAAKQIINPDVDSGVGGMSVKELLSDIFVKQEWQRSLQQYTRLAGWNVEMVMKATRVFFYKIADGNTKHAPGTLLWTANRKHAKMFGSLEAAELFRQCHLLDKHIKIISTSIG